MSVTDRWGDRLDDLGRLGQLRRLTEPRGIDFSSNDYLGFSKNRAQLDVDEMRSGTSSRLMRGNHRIWDTVEAALAEWQGDLPAALMMTSGYVANEGLLATVIEPQDWVASDELNHASIIDGIRLSRAEKFIFRHLDLEALENGLRHAAATRPRDRELFIVTEALFGMDGDRARLHEIDKLAVKYDAYLFVDEAHCTGCFGYNLAVCHQELWDLGIWEGGWRLLASVHTGGKALAVPGAFIACSEILKEYLINRCRHFIFTTALPPAVGVWWLHAIDQAIHADLARQHLHENAKYFRAALAERGIAAKGDMYIVPIILGDNTVAVGAAEALQKEGFDVRAIRPPTVPTGTARLRISIHADHDQATLLALVDALDKLLKRLKQS
jgi:8-amino-7-oxononanoate synthase